MNNNKEATNLYHIRKQLLINLKTNRTSIIHLQTPPHELMLDPIRRKTSILFLPLVHIALRPHFHEILDYPVVDLIDDPNVINIDLFLVLGDDH